MARQRSRQPPASATDGRLKAASALSRTIMHPDVTGVIDDYKRLGTEEARMAFADHFLGRTAGVMDEIWPVFYELLKRIEDGQLYQEPGYLGGDRTFDTFKEYFEYRVGRPFETFAQMEDTYRYARDYAPELFKEVFTDAVKKMAERVQQDATALARALKDGLTINSGEGPLSQDERANLDNIQISVNGGGGTRAEYLMRRVARDRPDILDRAAAGEFRSVRAAALEAGIAPRTQSIRMDDPESAARTIRKHMDPDTRRALARLLMDD